MIPPFPPTPNIPMPVKPWGIRLDGCEAPLENLLRQHLATYAPNRSYTAIEIGSAGCATLRAFRDIIADARGPSPWRVIGFDLPEGKAWSLDLKEAEANGVRNVVREPSADNLLVNDASLVLVDNPRLYIQDAFPFPIDFAFIDGCHGKCAGRDFEAIEAKVAPGGLVVFHDYGEAEQGTDWQCHCREFISVRSYVHRLGLATPCNAPRKGWRFVGEIPGTRAMSPSTTVIDARSWWERIKAAVRNEPFTVTVGPFLEGEGNSVAVVQRTGEPLEYNPVLAIADEPVVTLPPAVVPAPPPSPEPYFQPQTDWVEEEHRKLVSSASSQDDIVEGSNHRSMNIVGEKIGEILAEGAKQAIKRLGKRKRKPAKVLKKRKRRST